MSLFLGLDGGGTKTASVILNDADDELGRGRGGPCNIATCTDEQLRGSVSEACSSALESAGLPAETRFAAACAGVAGYTAKRRRAEFAELLEQTIPADHHRVEPDFTIAYWGATEGEPGVIVSAGTGAVVYGRNAQGEEARWDGRGFLLGDRGSAFHMGSTFLAGLLQRLDHGDPLYDLDRVVMARIGVEDADDIVEWTYRDFSPSKIASLAEIICSRAREGDQLAEMLVGSMGSVLRVSVEEVFTRLRAPDGFPVCLLGSLWAVGGPLLLTFLRGNSRSPEAPPILNTYPPRHDAAYGAALLAMRSREKGGSS